MAPKPSAGPGSYLDLYTADSLFEAPPLFISPSPCRSIMALLCPCYAVWQSTCVNFVVSQRRVCGSGALLACLLGSWMNIRSATTFNIVLISYAARTSEHEHEPALRWLSNGCRKITTFAVLHMRWHPTARSNLVGPSDATQMPIKSSCIIVQSTVQVPPNIHCHSCSVMFASSSRDWLSVLLPYSVRCTGWPNVAFDPANGLSTLTQQLSLACLGGYNEPKVSIR